jgi:2-phospho-L-lactate/phosphoenolpyruvate guanylyltransferase
VAARLDAVWVITRDDEVSAIARALGAKVLGEPENRGHTAAVALAQEHAAGAGAHVFLTIPGDVPLVTADEIRALAAAAPRPASPPRPGSAAFTPSRSRLGTNGVALAPPTVMPLEFGEPSFDNHLAAARERGLALEILALPGLGVDIDTPEDLPVLLAEGATTESGRLLARWDVSARLAATGT